MKVVYKWLRDYTDFKYEPEDLAHRLTMLGLEVDSLEKQGADHVIDIDLTPDRADCLSHYGIAREISLISGKKLKDIESDISTFASTDIIPDITIKDKDLCPRYAGLVLEGIQVGESPDFIKQRLETCGVRAINSIVDITNYVLLEMGHPLHAFDLELLSGRKIIVRRAKKGEKIKTLDDTQRELSDDMLVIADSEKPCAVAGVMGGADSEINDKSTSVLLESAYFDPVSVRRTAKKLGMHTEASHRFERGADYNIVVKALLRTASLVLEQNPKARVSKLMDVYPSPIKEKTVQYRNNRYIKIIGLPCEFKNAVSVLENIGLNIKSRDEAKQEIKGIVPSWRPDITREIDLIEEVVRVMGYDNVPSELPAPESSENSLYRSFKRQYTIFNTIRTRLTGSGLSEVVNYSFESEEFSKPLGCLTDSPIRISNPLDSNQNILRTGILSGLIKNLLHNLRFLNQDMGLFEISTVFSFNKKKEPAEVPMLGILLSGRRYGALYNNPDRSWDFFDIKGLVEAVLGDYHFKSIEFVQAEHVLMHKGRCASIILNGVQSGILGEMGYAKRAELGISSPVLLAQILLNPILEAGLKMPCFAQLERIHPVYKDLSLLAPKTGQYKDILDFIINRDYIEDARLIARYEGERISEDCVSLTFTVKLKNDPKNPMDDSGIQNCLNDLISSLQSQPQLGVKLR